jgi:hypothetical protein
MEEVNPRYPIENLHILTTQLTQRLPLPVQTLLKDYFNKIYAEHPWIKFDGGMPKDIACMLFLHWIVEYPSMRAYGILFFMAFVCVLCVFLQFSVPVIRIETDSLEPSHCPFFPFSRACV